MTALAWVHEDGHLFSACGLDAVLDRPHACRDDIGGFALVRETVQDAAGPVKRTCRVAVPCATFARVVEKERCDKERRIKLLFRFRAAVVRPVSNAAQAIGYF